MDGERFDGLARALARVGSRRAALRAAAGGLLGIGAAGLALDQAAAGCGKGKRRCDGRCRNVQKDDKNCGKCGRRCGPRETCVEGKCVEGAGGGGGFDPSEGCAWPLQQCDSRSDCCDGLECLSYFSGVIKFCF